jgi:antitoxin component YwqK of YwqJK toxin-antitoxin module
MNEQLIKFIELCLIDGVVTDKEREVIFRKSKELGVPDDECEIILEGMIHKSNSSSTENNINKTVDGLKEGYWEEKGRKNSIEKGNYKNNKRVGDWETYYDGKLFSKGEYLDDELEGVWEFFDYEGDGKLTDKITYKRGKYHGKWENYSNGELRNVMEYENGKKHGKTIFYENGKVWGTVIYRNGEEVSKSFS